MAKVIDGKLISKELKDELKEKVKAYKEQGIEINPGWKRSCIKCICR